MSTGRARRRASRRRWLAVQDADGGEAYTRAGDLQVEPNGLLTTGTGQPVLGHGGPMTSRRTRRSDRRDGTISIVPQGQAPGHDHRRSAASSSSIRPADVARRGRPVPHAGRQRRAARCRRAARLRRARGSNVNTAMHGGDDPARAPVRDAGTGLHSGRERAAANALLRDR